MTSGINFIPGPNGEFDDWQTNFVIKVNTFKAGWNWNSDAVAEWNLLTGPGNVKQARCENVMFAECESILDVKEKYESFWNYLNPRSETVVFVSRVRIVEETVEEKAETATPFRSIVRAEMAKALAKAFSEELLGYLGEDKMREVVRMNAAEADGRICHSHDFCDANQIMLDAMTKLGFELDDGKDGGENNNDGINLAWDIAKENSFMSQKIMDSSRRG
jgi:hypothetical protein